VPPQRSRVMGLDEGIPLTLGQKQDRESPGVNLEFDEFFECSCLPWWSEKGNAMLWRWSRYPRVAGYYLVLVAVASVMLMYVDGSSTPFVAITLVLVADLLRTESINHTIKSCKLPMTCKLRWHVTWNCA
jgi:hypothetical protein